MVANSGVTWRRGAGTDETRKVCWPVVTRKRARCGIETSYAPGAVSDARALPWPLRSDRLTLWPSSIISPAICCV